MKNIQNPIFNYRGQIIFFDQNLLEILGKVNTN